MPLCSGLLRLQTPSDQTVSAICYLMNCGILNYPFTTPDSALVGVKFQAVLNWAWEEKSPILQQG